MELDLKAKAICTHHKILKYETNSVLILKDYWEEKLVSGNKIAQLIIYEIFKKREFKWSVYGLVICKEKGITKAHLCCTGKGGSLQ